MQVAKVLIDGPRELIFDYAIPAELAGAVHAGSRVRIPLGPRRATGTVTEVVAEPNPGSPAAEFTVKPLLGLIGGQAAVPPALLRLARWLAPANRQKLFNRGTGLMFIGFGGALLGARA